MGYALNPASVSPASKHSDGAAEADRCPWCDQSITHEKFQEIRARIKQEEQQRIAAVQAKLQVEFVQRIAAKDAEVKAAVEDAARVSATAIEREKQESATREAKALAQGKKAAEMEMQELLARTQQDKQAAEAAKGAAEMQLAELKASQQRQSEQYARQEIQKVREAMEKAHELELNQMGAKSFEERQKFENTIDDLKRQVQKQTAGELGEGAEIDLYESLRAAFDADRIRRIDKGVPGADIWHEIVHNGEVCGRIIYDSKNRNVWRTEYATKLRDDQLAAEADHAVLATRVFPSGQSQLHILNGVLLANPARILVLVQMLRGHIIQVHRQRLSGHQRDRKVDQLYHFITSDRCAQLFQKEKDVTDALLEIEIKEQTAHSRVWKQRGELLKSSQKNSADLRYEIDRIIEDDTNDDPLTIS
jgi:hypothetical protein